MLYIYASVELLQKSELTVSWW